MLPRRRERGRGGPRVAAGHRLRDARAPPPDRGARGRTHRDADAEARARRFAHPDGPLDRAGRSAGDARRRAPSG